MRKIDQISEWIDFITLNIPKAKSSTVIQKNRYRQKNIYEAEIHDKKYRLMFRFKFK